jgi:hypothetical protein
MSKSKESDIVCEIEATVQARILLCRRQLTKTAFSDHQSTAIDRALTSLSDYCSADLRTLAMQKRKAPAASVDAEPMPTRGIVSYQPARA